VKKIFAAVASLSLLAAPLAASAQPFGHGGGGGHGYGGQHGSHFNGGGYRGGYGHGGYGRGGYGYGGAVAAGVLGLVVGSALANSYDYDRGYGYDQGYGYDGGYDCGWQNQAYRDGYGNVEYHQVQVCR
jgi:hypothetical protein